MGESPQSCLDSAMGIRKVLFLKRKRKRKRKQRTRDGSCLLCSLNLVRGQHEYLQQAQREHDLSSDTPHGFVNNFHKMSKKLDVSKFHCEDGNAKVSFVQEFLQPTVQIVQTALKDHAEKKHKEKKHDKAMRPWSNSVMLPSSDCRTILSHS